MSTKTTIKRIALVAVSALGLGVLTSVAPASATITAATDNASVTSITAGTPGAVQVGQTVYVPVTVAGSYTTGTARSTHLKVIPVTAPTSSSVTYNFAGSVSGALSAATTTSQTMDAATVVSAQYPSGNGHLGGGSFGKIGSVSTVEFLSTSGAATKTSILVYVAFTADKAGTYTFTVVNDKDDSEALTSGEVSSGLISVSTANPVASIVATAVSGTSTTAGLTTGSVVKLTLKDAAGNVTVPGAADAIALTSSSTSMSINGAASANLVAADFNPGKPNAGYAFVTLTSSTASTYTLTATGSGALAGTVTAAIPVKFSTTVAGTFTATGTDSTTGLLVEGPATGIVTGTGSQATSAVSLSTTAGSGNFVVPSGTHTWTITDTVTADAAKVISVKVTEIGGSISGVAGGAISYTIPVTLTAGEGSFDITATATGSSTALSGYQVQIDGSTDAYFAATIVATGGSNTLTPNVTSVSSAVGSSVGITYTLKDGYGVAQAGATLVVNVTGRNTKTLSAVTDANGVAVISYTDSGTTGTSDALSATATFVQAGAATTVTDSTVSVAYDAGNVVSTVKLTSDNYTTAGTANATVSAQNISVAAAGATGGARTITATVKNANGVALVGIPVTFSVSGTGAAIPTNKVTAYTSSTGVATSSVYAWVSGTYTVSAKAGAVTGTATETFNSQAGNERVISAAANGSVVTASAKDRYGNGVVNVRIYAKITSGTGYFGTGVLSTYADTDANGEAAFVVAGGSATVAVSNIAFSAVAGTQVGQTSAAKGYDIAGADATAFTASAAGTTVTAEKGVGASFDAAGVSSASVDVNATGSSDSIDAANEATDAANAATDAANAAAEAADAATAAAQDAQAAVAALATQVASLIAGIKAQITTLTNLVIKIQKKVRA